jgi:hypothetical protein
MKRLFLFAGILLSPFFFLAATTQIDWNTQVKNRPTFATVATTGAYSDLTGRPSLWNDPGSGTLLKRTGAFTFAAAVSNTDYQAALGFTPENSANKSAANGYAGLNASSIVPTANLPACVASGASHASGLVPDPGVTAGTTKFLREEREFHRNQLRVCPDGDCDDAKAKYKSGELTCAYLVGFGLVSSRSLWQSAETGCTRKPGFPSWRNPNKKSSNVSTGSNTK